MSWKLPWKFFFLPGVRSSLRKDGVHVELLSSLIVDGVGDGELATWGTAIFKLFVSFSFWFGGFKSSESRGERGEQGERV